MHTSNPFNNDTNNQLVDRLIGRSYEVVKSVYLDLPKIRDLYGDTTFIFMKDHWSSVEKVISNEVAIKNISSKIDSLLATPKTIETLSNQKITSITELSASKETSITELSNKIKNDITQQSQNITNQSQDIYRELQDRRDSYVHLLDDVATSNSREIITLGSDMQRDLNNQYDRISGDLNQKLDSYSSSLYNKYADLNLNLTRTGEEYLLSFEGRLDEVVATSESGLRNLENAYNNYSSTLYSTQSSLKEDFVNYANSEIPGYLESIREAASNAMFSYRYCSQRVEPFKTYPVRILQPTSEIKAGDHIVTWQGEVFEITGYQPYPEEGTESSGGTFTVGPYLHSIRGAKGEKGEAGSSALAVQIQGWSHTKAEFEELNLIGKPGWAWVIANDDTPAYDPTLLVWMPNTQEWVEQGNIQGPPGTGFNDELMDPDPLEYFIHVYGYTLEDYYGMLLVTIKDEEPLINASYSSVKVEQMFSNERTNQKEITDNLQDQINTTNSNLNDLATKEANDKDELNNLIDGNKNELKDDIANAIADCKSYTDNASISLSNSITNVNNRITTEINNIAITLENNNTFKENIENQVNEILTDKNLNDNLATYLDELSIKFDTFVMNSNNADFVKIFEDTLENKVPEFPDDNEEEDNSSGSDEVTE